MSESPPELAFRDALPQIAASCAVYLVVIQAGVNLAFSSILIPQLSMPESDIQVDLDSSSTVASIVTLSVACGALVCGPLMDKLGRRRLSTIICIPFILAWLLIALSRNLHMIYAARVLSGFCGGLTTVALVYVSEISSPQYRGMLLCLNSVAVSVGIILTYFLNIFLAWRTIGFVYALMSLLSLLIIARMPESPSWMLAFDNDASQAQLSLEWLYRQRHLSTFYYRQLIDNEKLRRSNLGGSAETAAAAAPMLAKVLRQPQVYKPLIILLCLFLFQQCSGCYILIFYTINIFRNLSPNFSRRVNENMALMLLGALRLIVSVIASGLARKCHRKTLLHASSLGMMAFIGVAGVLVRDAAESGNFLALQATPNDTPAEESGAEVYLLVAILGYIAFSSLGVMILPWTLTSELFPIEVKGKMSGIIVLVAYFFMFCAVKMFPYSLDMYGMEVMFYLFAVSSLAFCTFVHYFLPETYGKSLNDIQRSFGSGADAK